MNDIRRGVIIISGRRRVGVHIIYLFKSIHGIAHLNLISLLPTSLATLAMQFNVKHFHI